MDFPDSYFEDEVRDGFYVSSMMKRAWAAQLELLAMVDQICRKHNIPYFAEWGTLLGAVRHAGMIPWDDDMDICMKRKDYIKFLSVLEKELPGECWFMDYRTSEDLDNMAGRLQNSQTICLIEGELLEKYHGFPFTAGLDIFQLDFLPADEEEEKQYYFLVKVIIATISALNTVKDNPDDRQEKEIAHALNEIEGVCHVTFDRSQPMKRQLRDLLENKVALVYGERDAKELMHFPDYMENTNCKMPKTLYAQAVSMPFENMEIPVPAGYDTLLRVHKYGNYMDPVRGGSAHEYPIYKKQQEYLSTDFGIDVFRYEMTEEELEQAVRKPDESLPRQETLKSRVKEFLPLFHEAHDTFVRFLEDENVAAALEILGECQNTAVQIGSMIEEEMGEGHATVTLLEQYCETVYRYYEKIAGEGEDTGMQGETREKIQKEMMEELAAFEKRLADSIEQDLKEKREIVFVPYKPSLWGTLDSVWQSAVEEDDTEVYVIPVPYYYKDVYGKPKKDEPHYETEGYPDYVTLTSYEEYNFETHHPDTIVIQCPYDEYNYALTVHPFFYARNLKQYTDRLVYIPALVMDEIGPGDGRAREMLKAYCNMPGVVHADKVIVQSEQMKDVYVELLTDFAGEDTKEIWENKIVGSGSPVYDYEKKVKKEDMDIPEEWLEIIKKPDGSWKKIVLYSTSASALLCHGEKMIEKMKEVFATFQETAGDLAVIWRPDPKVREMLRKNHSVLWNQYRGLLEEYRDGAWGILDTSGDAGRAVELCDAFYGDAGSTMNACHVRKKPAMWQSVS